MRNLLAMNLPSPPTASKMFPTALKAIRTVVMKKSTIDDMDLVVLFEAVLRVEYATSNTEPMRCLKETNIDDMMVAPRRRWWL